jgi:hypothetical protein
VATYRISLVIVAMSIVPNVALGQHVLGLTFGYCVVGAPLTASQTLDYEPMGNASDPVPVHRDGMLYRDSEGRTRTELKYPGQPQPLSIFLMDCVAGYRYWWRVGDTIAHREKMKHVGPTVDKTDAPKSLGNDKDSVVIEGVATHHSHRVTEMEGKEQISDRWFAPSLDLEMVSVFYRADLGKTTVRRFNLNLAEPDPALFQIPREMTIKDDGTVND